MTALERCIRTDSVYDTGSRAVNPATMSENG